MSDIDYQGKPIVVRLGEPTKVKLPPRMFRVRLKGFLFESAKTFILPSAMHGIRKLVDVYHDDPDAHVLVSGHTDTVGPDDYNRGLSMERAKSVAAFLVDDADTWMSWYHGGQCSDAWGAREDQYMLSALGFYAEPVDGAASKSFRASVSRFQEANGLESTGTADAGTRHKLVERYLALDGTTLPKTAPAPKTHGCGPWHLAVPTGANVDKQENRRVEVFIFDSDVTPAPRSLCPWNGCPEYPEWVRKSRYTIDVSVDGPRAKPTVTKFFGRIGDHDDDSVEAHSLILPSGRAVVLHWEVSRATSVRIEEMTLEGGQRDLPLGSAAALTYSDGKQIGSFKFTPADDATYLLHAAGPDGDADDPRAVLVDLYAAASSSLRLDVGSDYMALREGSAAPAPPSSSGGGPRLGFIIDPGGPLGVKSSNTDFLDLKATSEQLSSPSIDIDSFRATIRSTLRLAQNFGADDRPPGRFDIYLDLVSWDDPGRTAMKPLTGGASSCGMFIRMIWWILGARNNEMDEAFTSNRIIRLLLDYAGRANATHAAGSFTPDQFLPEIGDSIYLYRSVPNPNYKPKPAPQPPADPSNWKERADQHIFTVIKRVDDASGFDLYSVDAGSPGPDNFDTPNNGIHVAKRRFNRGSGFYFVGSARPINTWIKIAEMKSLFTANRIELIRNAAQMGPTQNNQPVVAHDTVDNEVGP